jgi:hypothetical protein
MKEIFAGVIAFFSGVVGIVLLISGLSYVGWYSYDYFAPKYRATENKVFKESEQYNDGMLRDLENLEMEYTNADQAHKDALRSIVLHRFSVYDENRLPYNLRSFYDQLRTGKL